jgi:FSR family fosmidomycin resistance protein-like MFS transporter
MSVPAPTRERPSFITRRLLVLAAGHFTIDAYSSFFLPLLPLLVQRLRARLRDGRWPDRASRVCRRRSRSRCSACSRIACDDRGSWRSARCSPAVFMAFIGLASSYAMLVGLLMLGGLGVAMFHPQTAKLAGASSPQRGLAMSFWVTGGTLGWALGPAFATAIVHHFGLAHTLGRDAAGLAMCAFLFIWFRRVAPQASHRRVDAPIAELRPAAVRCS